MGSMKCCIFRSLRRQTPTWKLFPLFSRHKGKLLKMPSNCHSRSVSRLEKPKGERCYGHVQPEAQSHAPVELERPIRKRGRVAVPGLINSHDFHERRFSDIDGVRKIGPTDLIIQSPFRHLFIKVRNEWLGTKLHPLKPFVRSWSSNWSHNSVKCENMIKLRLRKAMKSVSVSDPLIWRQCRDLDWSFQWRFVESTMRQNITEWQLHQDQLALRIKEKTRSEQFQICTLT